MGATVVAGASPRLLVFGSDSRLLRPETRGGGAYLLLYASQNPLAAMFLRLRREQEPLPAMSTLSPEALMQAWQSRKPHVFGFAPSEYVDDRSLDFSDPGVLVHLVSGFDVCRR